MQRPLVKVDANGGFEHEQAKSPGRGLATLQKQLETHRAWLEQTSFRDGADGALGADGATPVGARAMAGAGAGGGARGESAQNELREAGRAYAQRLRGAAQRPAAANGGAEGGAAAEAEAEAAAAEAEAALRSMGGAPGEGAEAVLTRLSAQAAAVRERKERRAVDGRRASVDAAASNAAAAASASRRSSLLSASVASVEGGAEGGGAYYGAEYDPPSPPPPLLGNTARVAAATAPRGSPGSPGRGGGGGGGSRPAVVERLESWAAHRAARLQRSAAETAEAEAAAQPGAPTLTPRSLALVGRMRGRHGPIETQLLQEAARRREDFEAAAAEAVAKARREARPALTARAEALPREGDVAERLYAYAQVYEARRTERAHRHSAEAAAGGVHARGAQVSGARVNAASAYAAVRTQDVSERLHALGSAEARALRLEALATPRPHSSHPLRRPSAAELEAELAVHPAAVGRRASSAGGALAEMGGAPGHPLLTARSEKLAAKSGEGAFERLTKPSKQALLRAAEAERMAEGEAEPLPSHVRRQLLECTFSPHITPKTEAIAAAKRMAAAMATSPQPRPGGGAHGRRRSSFADMAAAAEAGAMPRHHALYEDAAQRAAELERLRSEYEARELSGCPFAPNAHAQGAHARGGGAGAASPRSSTSPGARRGGGAEGGGGGHKRGIVRTASAGARSASSATSGRASDPGGRGYNRVDREAEVTARLAEWARRRQQRLDAQREAAIEAELEACTFNPNMADPSTSMLLPPAEGGRALPEPSPDPVDDLDNPLHLRRAVSLSRFVARQQAGRILADQRRAVPHASGETWSRAPTRTEEFALATSPGADAEREQLRASIAALKRPLAKVRVETAAEPAVVVQPPMRVTFAERPVST